MAVPLGTVGRAVTMSVSGVHAVPILVEAVQLNGLPTFTVVGLPDATVNEARERLRAAVHVLGLRWPACRLTVNLSPAAIAKHGTGFDLALLVAILGSLGYGLPHEMVVLGELGLDGTVRPIRGILPAVVHAVEHGYRHVLVPADNASEAQLVDGATVVGVHHSAQVARMCGMSAMPIPDPPEAVAEQADDAELAMDMADVKGHTQALIGVEIAAAGGHHILLVGPPGVGKSMIAQRMPSIMPPLTHDQAVDVAMIYSLVTGMTKLPDRPPYAAPHHTATRAAIVGGGGSVPCPGAITLAHNGILFLDEMPEFSPHVIQALRQPMESGYIDIARARETVRFPSCFQLVAAANPCRCGKRLDAPGACTCSALDHRRYRTALGGAVRDRIDIWLPLLTPSPADLRSSTGIASADMAERVAQARERQEHRHSGLNAALSGRWLREHTVIPPAFENAMDRALSRGHLSVRGIDRIARLAWSACDLAGHSSPTSDDVALALSLRGVSDV